jgi:glycosyltransferase involved in cell wall biosynthesis
MKLLHLISSVNPKGGGPIEGIRQLHAPVVSLGAEVHVACCDAPDAPWLANIGLTKVIPLGPAYFGYAFAPRLVQWLRAHAHEYDAIIVNGLWQYTSFAAWRALAGTKTPYFVFTHGMLDPWFKHTYPLKHLKKWLYWPWAEYRVLRDARRVIFTCEDERLLARQSFWLYRVNEVVTSYGTASPPQDADGLKDAFLTSYPSLRERRLILFLSRIHEKKGCDLVLEAFAKVAAVDHSLHLVMAGPDQTGWLSTLQAQAQRLGIADRITWPGMLQGDLKWGAFYAAEVFVLPSHQENFGIVVAEALACGKPVLISNKVNIWREIEADDVGFVDADTFDGTVRNFEKWLALRPTEYVAMSERAHATFRNRFHIDQAAQRLLEIIKESI